METLALIGLCILLFIAAPIAVGKLIAWGATDDEEQRKADFHGGPGY
jgi:hypothetical protein